MIIDNWPKVLQKDLNEFFEFPYLFNSPQLMVDSIIKLKITNHIPLKKEIFLNTAFYKAKIRYRKIEEGLWFFATEMDVNENVIAKSVYDEKQSSDYYLLTFSVFEHKFPFKDLEDITLLSTCWTFSKPKTEVTTHFYKHTTGKFFSFAINQEWVNNNSVSKKIPQKKVIENFLNSKKSTYTWLDIAPKAHDLMREINETLEVKSDVRQDSVLFNKNCLKLLVEFLNNSFSDSRILDNVSLRNLDYYNVAKAEKMILDNLHLPFIGIVYIAKELKISPTKLKSNFKQVFGFSMLQYHKEKNMLRAMQLVQNSDVRIGNIAKITGYNNASKFASNFKKRYGELPYKVRCIGIS
jgi:AraC-like DNA-binding protein